MPLNSAALAADLGARLDAIRLARNLSQQELASRAGVSRSTLTRMAAGHSISLDSFIRVVSALGLADQLTRLLPDPEVRPVELAQRAGRRRQRARRKNPATTENWTWADDGEEP